MSYKKVSNFRDEKVKETEEIVFQKNVKTENIYKRKISSSHSL